MLMTMMGFCFVVLFTYASLYFSEHNCVAEPISKNGHLYRIETAFQKIKRE